MTAFSTAEATVNYVMARVSQGAGSSSGTASLILKLIMAGILKPQESYTYVDNILLSSYELEHLYDSYIATLKRADPFKEPGCRFRDPNCIVDCRQDFAQMDLVYEIC